MMKRTKEKKILKSLLDISGFISYVDSPELIISLLIEECVILSEASWGAILTYDRHSDQDSFHVTKNMSDSAKGMMSSCLAAMVKDMFSEYGKSAALREGFWSERETEERVAGCLGVKTKGISVCPIIKKDDLIGLVVIVDKKAKGRFSPKDREALSIICHEASIVIENIRLFKDKLQNERLAAIGQTLSGISHCIKNILQGISSGSSLISAGIKTNDIDCVGKAWAVVEKNTKRISDLVMDMLYYSKDRKPALEKIDPGAVVDDVAELVRQMFRDRGIELKVAKGELPPSIMANEKGLHRSILNLVMNAADACDKKDSCVKIDASSDKAVKVMKISVTDNGKGMTRETLAKIFQPFYSEKSKGTGLGLAITEKIINEHGGSIKVDSEPGKGTMFEIRLPIDG